MCDQIMCDLDDVALPAEQNVSNIGFRLSGVECRFYGFHFSLSNIVFRFLGLRFRVQGFWFRVESVGFGVYVFHQVI